MKILTSILIFMQMVSCSYDKGTNLSSGTMITPLRSSSLVEINALVSNLTDSTYLSLNTNYNSSSRFVNQVWTEKNFISIFADDSTKLISPRKWVNEHFESRKSIFYNFPIIINDLHLLLNNQKIYVDGKIKKGFYSLENNDLLFHISVVRNNKYRYRVDVFKDNIKFKSYYFNLELTHLMILITSQGKINKIWAIYNKTNKTVNLEWYVKNNDHLYISHVTSKEGDATIKSYLQSLENEGEFQAFYFSLEKGPLALAFNKENGSYLDTDDNGEFKSFLDGVRPSYRP